MVNGLDPLLCDRGLNGVDVMVSPGGVNGGGRRGPGGEDISEESSANGIWGWEENDEEGTPCSPASPRCLITSFIDRMTVAQNKVNLVGLMGGISSEAGSRELIFTLDNMRDVEAKELDADTSDTESFFSDKGSTKDPSHLSVRLLAVECSPSCWRLEVNDGTGRNSNFTFPKSVVAKKDAALEVRFTFSDDPQRKPELDIHLMESQAVTPAVPRQEMDKEVQTVIALGVEQIGEECRNSSAEITVEVRIPKEAEAKTPESVVREVDVKEMEEESSVDSKIRSVQEKLDKFSEKVNILSDIVTTREESEVGKADYSPKTSSEVPRKANVVCKALKKVELEIAPLRRELIDLHNKMLDVQGPFDVTDKRLAPTYTAHRYTDSLKEFYKSIGYEPRYSLPDEDTRSGYSLDKSSVYEDARSTCSRREGDWGLPLLQDMYSRLADLARTRPVEEDARSQVSSLSSTSTLVQARYPKAVKRKASYRLCLQDPMWSEPEDIFGDCESFLGDPWLLLFKRWLLYAASIHEPDACGSDRGQERGAVRWVAKSCAFPSSDLA
ncbi:hypothetical protein AAG570_003894 [Ranatra chinensis]|uniref:Uncharacterized protein n=1 Tax=Ranatra chinensis TaxID=642074 RepID=A0ABD0Y278_9HEMI